MSLRPSNTPKVTVEDLLRLKRAERPDPEFWNKFEVELRQKQLAALVQRRPWWERIPLFVGRRAYLPIGATAAIAFTLVSVRFYAPSSVATVAPLEPARETVAVTAPSSVETRHDIVSSVQRNEPTSLANVAEQPVLISDEPLSEKMPAQSETLTPWSARREVDSPSARSMAANLAQLEASDPELTRALLNGGRLSGTTTVAEVPVARAAVELAGLATVSSRRNRLLASMSERQFVQDPTAPEVVRERLARRLGDTDYGNGWTRVGLKADRVSLKF